MILFRYICALAAYICIAIAQVSGPFIKYRILIILDASGSMGEKWGGKSKYQIALETLARVIDSVQRENPRVEFGLRLLGHQYPREDHNCQDTRLELPFGRHDKNQILALATRYKPKGWTPLAYALQKAAQDFRSAGANNNVLNSIILITDGIETCGGDVCRVIQELYEQRITIKPFVIGMGAEEKQRKYYECAEAYYPANNRQKLEQVLHVAIKRSVNQTTFQLFLLDARGKPTVTNVAFSLIDSKTGKPLYSYVHRLSASGMPDTLKIDPRGVYDLVVHTTPLLWKKRITFSPGKHNIISLPCPLATVTFRMPYENSTRYPIIVRDSRNGDIVYMSNVGVTFKLLAGKYDFEVLTTPVIRYNDVRLYAGSNKTFNLPAPGKAYLSSSQDYISALFGVINGNQYEHVLTWRAAARSVKALELLPGEYILVYRPVNALEAEASLIKRFRVLPKQTVTIRY